MKRPPKQRFGLDIANIFQPRSVALIGASEREGSIGSVVLANLLKARFKGRVFPVNPEYQKVQNRRCYPDVGALPQVPDLAVIATPAKVVPAVLAQCGEKGIRFAVILSAGFRETGRAGEVLEKAVLKKAKRYGIRFLGPNCLGIIRPSLRLNASFSQSTPRRGRLALVSQSGAVCTALLDWAGPRGIGFSNVISTGISADVDFGEILDFLVMDSDTDAIMMYIEGIHESRQFMSALRAASRAKPVVVMKAGRHAEGMQAAVSHTGALVGADDVFDAALNRAGVVRVREYASLFAVAATLHAGVRTEGPRLAIVTNGGGPGVIAADQVADRRLQLAKLSEETRSQLKKFLPAAAASGNPVDVLGDADADRYSATVAACLADPGVDAVLAILLPQAITRPLPVAEAVAELAGKSRKPVLTCWMGDQSMRSSRKLLVDHGIPTYTTPEGAVEAFAAAATYNANQQLLLQVPEPVSQESAPDATGARLIIEEVLASGRSVLDLAESKALLASFGIPILKSMPAHKATEALAIAEEIGYPVAMKIHSSDITHKSDSGGVRLGLNNGSEVRQAYKEMVAKVSALQPEADIDGVLIEPMWHPADGRELMLGVMTDPVFGPVISFGLGGTMVEVIRDRAIALPPLNRYLARRMIEQSRAARYLAEFRGKPAANLQALEDVILRMSELVCELPEVEQLDINPLIVDPQGALAVDARVVVRKTSASARPYAHMAIHPYPSNLITESYLKDGSKLTIRPIRPEDATLERDFVNGLSERSRFLRFMYALSEITPEMLSRFTQIDYDREMALIALVGEADSLRQIGVARYVTYPDGRGCEFAVVVSDDFQRMGIARQLLSDVIDVARDRRLEYMDGIVLRQNENMIRLAESLGFDVERSADDPELVSLQLKL
ncbi:MAG: bifunctional acetate--CoA ligase family protein/GNAT family N-acetyltransferase [Gammaproteobacteria bacterium]